MLQFAVYVRHVEGGTLRKTQTAEEFWRKLKLIIERGTRPKVITSNNGTVFQST